MTLCDAIWQTQLQFTISFIKLKLLLYSTLFIIQ